MSLAGRECASNAGVHGFGQRLLSGGRGWGSGSKRSCWYWWFSAPYYLRNSEFDNNFVLKKYKGLSETKANTFFFLHINRLMATGENYWSQCVCFPVYSETDESTGTLPAEQSRATHVVSGKCSLNCFYQGARGMLKTEGTGPSCMWSQLCTITSTERKRGTSLFYNIVPYAPQQIFV